MFIDSPSQKCIHWCISNEQISYYNTKYIGFASNRDGGFADYSPFADFLGAANAELWAHQLHMIACNFDLSRVGVK